MTPEMQSFQSFAWLAVLVLAFLAVALDPKAGDEPPHRPHRPDHHRLRWWDE